MTYNIDKEIHEKLMGKCWHEFTSMPSRLLCCNKCNGVFDRDEKNPSFLDPGNYFKLWQKIREHKKYPIFRGKLNVISYKDGIDIIDEILLNEVRGREEIYKFFVEGK